MTKAIAILLLALLAVFDLLLVLSCGELERRNGYKAKEDDEQMEWIRENCK